MSDLISDLSDSSHLTVAADDASLADVLRASGASVSFHSLNVRSFNVESRRGFNVWLRQRAPHSDVIFLQEIWLRPPAVNGCRRSYTSSVWAPNRLSANLSCGVAIVCRIPESVLTPIFLDDAGRLALAEFTAPSLPPMLVASVYAPAERHERPAFFRFAHQQLREALDLRPHLRGRVVLGGDFNVCLTDDDKQGGNLDRVGSPELSALMSDLLLVDTWRVAHPGVQAWSHVSGITATRIDLILASCAAAAADMSVAPLATDHRLVSATFGEVSAPHKRALLWRMHPSVLADDEACAAVRSLLECNCLLGDYAAWLNWTKLKREVAKILKKFTIKAARARNEALASAKQELARATAAVSTSASPMNLRAATEAEARVQACNVARLQEDARTLKASALASVARPLTKSEATYPRELYESPQSKAVVKNPAAVAQRCTRHFEELFAEVAVDDLSGDELLDNWEPPELDEAAREALAKRFTLLELHNALPRADLHTAPGPDDLPWQIYCNL